MAEDISELPWVDTPVASYQGKGILTLEGEGQINCAFIAAQLPNGEIRFSCSWDPYEYPISNFNSPKLLAFEGTTLEGKKLTPEVNLFYTGHKVNYSHSDKSHASLTFLASQLRVYHQKVDVEPTPKTFVFGCTNFKFLGTIDTSSGLALPLQFGPYEVTVYRVPQYKETIEKLRIGKGVEVTCEISFEVKAELELDELLTAMHHLCLMLSIARGTLVTWIYYNTYSDDRQQLLTVHRDSPTRSFSSMQLLHHMYPEHLLHFIKTCYNLFVDQFEQYSLDEVAGAFVDARGTSFLETRGLATASLIDVLRGRWAERHFENKGRVISRSKFNKHVSELSDMIKQTVQQIINDLNDDQAEKMAEKVPELNRVGFRRVLRTMLEALNVPFTDTELDNFIKSRNSLVHKGRYRSQQKWNEYALILSLLDRIILKLIGYSGNYVDCRDWEIRRI